MNMLSKHFLIITATALLVSCNNGNENNNAAENDTTVVATVPEKVTLSDVPDAPEFPDARLSLKDVKATPTGDSVKIDFAFDVKNYELKMQTSDADAKQCSNSEKGQHIHFILDNAPYAALYEPKHSVTVLKGREHYLMAFLSRSYHMSLKHEGAALLYHFKTDANGKLLKMDDPKTPMVFYSRPKGDYVGKDTKNLLLDFYVWNAPLAQDKYQVEATINNDQKMMITDWKPYFLNGLPMGKNTIMLRLMDNDGNKVDGAMTEATREFNLAAEEPMR